MKVVKAQVLVEGRVQGVFYRGSTCREAQSLNIKGWVTNCVNGNVEAVFEGAETNVNKMIEWCKRGPSAAIVKNVKVDWKEPEGSFSDFSVKY